MTELNRPGHPSNATNAQQPGAEGIQKATPVPPQDEVGGESKVQIQKSAIDNSSIASSQSRPPLPVTNASSYYIGGKFSRQYLPDGSTADSTADSTTNSERSVTGTGANSDHCCLEGDF